MYASIVLCDIFTICHQVSCCATFHTAKANSVTCIPRWANAILCNHTSLPVWRQTFNASSVLSDNLTPDFAHQLILTDSVHIRKPLWCYYAWFQAVHPKWIVHVSLSNKSSFSKKDNVLIGIFPFFNNTSVIEHFLEILCTQSKCITVVCTHAVSIMLNYLIWLRLPLLSMLYHTCVGGK